MTDLPRIVPRGAGALRMRTQAELLQAGRATKATPVAQAPRSLVTKPEVTKRTGRPPKGDRAMTPAERKRAQRAKAAKPG